MPRHPTTPIFNLSLEFHPRHAIHPMPKLKTHKASAKRIKKRANGLKRHKAYGTHKLGKRSTKRKRLLRRSEPLDAANAVAVRRSLGQK